MFALVLKFPYPKFYGVKYYSIYFCLQGPLNLLQSIPFYHFLRYEMIILSVKPLRYLSERSCLVTDEFNNLESSTLSISSNDESYFVYKFLINLHMVALNGLEFYSSFVLGLST